MVDDPTDPTHHADLNAKQSEMRKENIILAREDLARRFESLAHHARTGRIDGVLLVVSFAERDPPITTLTHVCTEDEHPLAPFEIHAKMIAWWEVIKQQALAPLTYLQGRSGPLPTMKEQPNAEHPKA